jgi:hypothetical protein
LDFAFQLSEQEWHNLRFQIGTSSSSRGGRRYMPFVFTEQGVAMLSAVLSSDIAIEVSFGGPCWCFHQQDNHISPYCHLLFVFS